MHKNEGYLGNINVKRAGVQSQWTEEEILEYKKCMENPVYFIENYIKIISLDEGLVPFKLYGYQDELITHFDESRFSIVLACRQSGKSITACAYLVWYLLFQPEQTIAILANKGSTAREMLARITTMLEHVPFFLQPGTKVLNKGSIEFENDSRIIASATGANSIRGLSVNLLYLDEFAFVDNAEQFYTSTYPVVTSGGKSKTL
jgi:phage terminase large subunit-like protein